MTNYVSAVPLKELGLGLGIEHLGDEQAQELTDDYSLPALKVESEVKPGRPVRTGPDLMSGCNHEALWFLLSPVDALPAVGGTKL